MSTMTPLEETVINQRRVSAPDVSAWVAANAGAGKTKVLTDRVMRLLLAGVGPSRILSITFTKAAAAEMAGRLFDRLGKWAFLDDAGLCEELKELDGNDHRSTEQISDARRLFARALETPSGLKIQTIHSFCESVLKRFPLEAGIAPGFRVMEEVESDDTLSEIVDHIAVQALYGEGDNIAAFQLLNERIGEASLKSSLYALARKGDIVEKAITKAGGLQSFLEKIAKLIGANSNGQPDDILQYYADELDMPALEAVYSALLSGGAKDGDHALSLRALLDSKTLGDMEEAGCSLFLTGKGLAKKKLATLQAQKHLPDIQETLRAAQQKFLTLQEQLKSIDLYELTSALYHLSMETYTAYVAEKRSQGLLDFGDLISKTAALFQQRTVEWVLYKMDQEIAHVLVDEAQDTSDGQWQVIEGPLQEFFSGLGAREEERTVFVVGDEKQSIYSFQGANVNLFREKQKTLFDLVTAAEQDFLVEDLVLSFRSSSAVLSFVDTVFEQAEAAKGVSDMALMRHLSNRPGAAGLVELWPLVMRPEKTQGNAWDAPVDQPDPAHPARQLAQHIAGTIRDWLDTEEILPAKGRAIQPGDIMILCQSRGPVFQEIVRELSLKKVPTAGADRIKLMEHIAVQDLVSATKFALQPTDDLSLAELLKSPLFNFSDDDLFQLTRLKSATSLWQQLRTFVNHADDDELTEKCKHAATILKSARSAGVLKGAYSFYTALLEEGNPSGWKRFYARLGLAAREPLQEFLNETLDYENQHPRTLQGFLQHIAGVTTELKREINGSENLVRIMTVHGSKGLEADIVFLADATRANFSKVDALMPVGEKHDESEKSYSPQAGAYVYSGSKASDNEALGLARALAIEGRAEEYRRLLYVAATRARDRLYICGMQIGNLKPETMLAKPVAEASWYALATHAFARLKNTSIVGEAPWGGNILRLETAQTAAAEVPETAALRAPVEAPDWLLVKTLPEPTARRLSPSHMGSDEEILPNTPTEFISYAPSITPEATSPYRRGNALHLLLEKLPSVEPTLRAERGMELLKRHYDDINISHHKEWLEEVLTVLSDPAFAAVFGKGSRAEVPLMGMLGSSENAPVVSGQIDRLCVLEDKILIVDYKTNRPPPETIAGVPQVYITQLAAYRALLEKIYPGKDINCALLWTWACRLMPIPKETLDHAYVHHVMGQDE